MTPKDVIHMQDGDQYFQWSPDSKWLLVDWKVSLNNVEVLLISKDGKQRKNLTQSGYYDFTPKWVNDGSQIMYFTNRDGLKSYATSGSFETDVYSMFLNQESWDKFNNTKEEYDLLKMIEEAAKKG